MGDCKDLAILNASPWPACASVEAILGCCDNPNAGLIIGWLPPGGTQEILVCRTSGHGCNGQIGQFVIALANPYGILRIVPGIQGDGWIQAGTGQPGQWTTTSSGTSGQLTSQLTATDTQNYLVIRAPYRNQPEPSLWLSGGRALSGGEIAPVEELLPGLDPSSAHVWGEASQTPAFNCLAWAVGVTDRVLPSPTDGIALAQCVAFMAQRGIQQVSSEDQANIIAWGRSSVSVEHLSVFKGFPDGTASWSSKLGFRPDSRGASGLLLTHGVDAPKTLEHSKDGYGHALAYFYDPNGDSPDLAAAGRE
jgi:hypothetical protein